MPQTRSEIVIKKICAGFTSQQLESFFSVNRNVLLNEVKQELSEFPDGNERWKILQMKLKKNDRQR